MFFIMEAIGRAKAMQEYSFITLSKAVHYHYIYFKHLFFLIKLEREILNFSALKSSQDF